MDKIKISEWISLAGSGYGDGYGDGSGSGAGSGDGSGSGSGDGSGSGYGAGSGSGSGDGYGYGSGSGSGSGSGDGYGSGSGSGDGYGSGAGDGAGSGAGYGYIIKTHKGHKVFRIDSILTVILNCKGNCAKGYMINSDFTTTQCYIVKSNGCFAHGPTLRKASYALQDKIFKSMSVEDRISEFLERFEKNKLYSGALFFDWHNRLTGSCLMGRQQFVNDHEINLEDMYTVSRFIAMTENHYGGNIIKKLKQYYN